MVCENWTIDIISDQNARKNLFIYFWSLYLSLLGIFVAHNFFHEAEKTKHRLNNSIVSIVFHIGD